MGGKSTLVATKLKKLREGFIRQLPSQFDALKGTYAALCEGVPAEEALEELHRCLHNFQGACACFGLDTLCAIAAEAEGLVRKVRKGEADPDIPWRPVLEEHIARMSRDISGIDPLLLMDFQVLESVAAAETFQEKERKVVYLCQYDSFQRLNLATQIGCFGFEVVSFGDLEQFRNAVRSGHPDVIVMDLAFPDRPTGGADIIREIRAEREIPTVFISSFEDLPSRLTAIRAGAGAYFVTPVNVTDLCTTLNSLITPEVPDPYRIMIVDDDAYMTKMCATILNGAGMETRGLNDPLQTLPLLFDFKPDLILMDMHMPGCNGMELAKAIRLIDAYFSIPIIFLSCETDTDLQFEARRMGGDEFLTKPIRPEHLISTVSVRAERMKIIRSFMVRDSMTGLFNHTATKDHVDLAIEQARRRGETLCFALIDLDYFKNVNDNYGHQAGDRVLMALARLLKQRLRKSDMVGRTGGEEFAVILPACGILDAGALLEKILENFAAINFPTGEDSFNSTFSCGVASLADSDTVDKLYKAADEALYIAKREGRNRVVAVGCGE